MRTSTWMAMGKDAKTGWALPLLVHCAIPGALATAILLVFEHRLVRADDLSRVPAAFFQVNVAIAFVMLMSGVWRAWATLPMT